VLRVSKSDCNHYGHYVANCSQFQAGLVITDWKLKLLDFAVFLIFDVEMPFSYVIK